MFATPAGLVNPAHTHPCGHGLYVLEGELVTHKGTFGPGVFVWFPEGEVMEHGASPEGDVTVLFITNKSFRIDYVGGEKGTSSAIDRLGRPLTPINGLP